METIGLILATIIGVIFCCAVVISVLMLIAYFVSLAATKGYMAAKDKNA